MYVEPLIISEHAKSHRSEFASAVLAGLTKRQKTLPCRFLYDAKGSELFEEITRLPEYYPTRTETKILTHHASEMLQDVHDDGALVEFGSGSSVKTEILLRHLSVDVDYVAIDVSRSALASADKRLSKRFPLLNIYPIVADFSKAVDLPPCLLLRPKVGFFPGSTIGNLEPAEAVSLLAHFREILGPNARLIIGVDLKKDETLLIPAYDDAEGVTAEFNLNLLVRINRELDADIDIEAFKHRAVYNRRLGRIEMHLVSLKDLEFSVLGQRIRLARGETIHTENSHKYAISEFQKLAERASWQPARVWTDPHNLFSVHELR